MARDPETGRFAGTDGWGRSPRERAIIEARRAEVARRYPKQRPAVIARELDGGRWSKQTIDKDVAELVRLGKVERQRPGPRRKYPDAEERPCACGCDVLFTPPNWAPDQRFLSIAHARRADRTPLVQETARKLKTAARRRVDEEITRRLNAAGYLTSRQLAAERKVTESVVSSWIARGLLDAERRIIEGEPHRLIARAEVERFNAEVWPRTLERMGPGLPSNWKGPARQIWGGRLGGAAGAVYGIEGASHGYEGGAPRLATSEQDDEVWRLYGEKKTYREIAAAVFGDQKYKDRVARVLRADA